MEGRAARRKPAVCALPRRAYAAPLASSLPRRAYAAPLASSLPRRAARLLASTQAYAAPLASSIISHPRRYALPRSLHPPLRHRLQVHPTIAIGVAREVMAFHFTDRFPHLIALFLGQLALVMDLLQQTDRRERRQRFRQPPSRLADRLRLA